MWITWADTWVAQSCAAAPLSEQVFCQHCLLSGNHEACSGSDTGRARVFCICRSTRKLTTIASSIISEDIPVERSPYEKKSPSICPGTRINNRSPRTKPMHPKHTNTYTIWARFRGFSGWSGNIGCKGSRLEAQLKDLLSALVSFLAGDFWEEQGR